MGQRGELEGGAMVGELAVVLEPNMHDHGSIYPEYLTRPAQSHQRPPDVLWEQLATALLDPAGRHRVTTGS